MQKRKGQAKRIIKIIVVILAIAAYLAGAYVVVYPHARILLKEQESHMEAESFLENIEVGHSEYEEGIREVQKAGAVADGIDLDMLNSPNLKVPYADLLSAMVEYNQEIYQNRQADFKDAWSYTAQRFDLEEYGIHDEVVAVIDIPALESSFPIYLGATAEHMSKGLAQLTETSMPIGGRNTNCVLAGHRGWDNGKYLKDIEKVQLGDIITVTNLWYEMKYEVVEIKIIVPNDIQEVLIQDGRDLITISTCHPYGSGGLYRYLVICERVKEDPSTQIIIEDNNTLPSSEKTEEIKPPVYIAYFSSEDEILFDDIVFYVGVGLIILLPIVVALTVLKNRRKKKRKK